MNRSNRKTNKRIAALIVALTLALPVGAASAAAANSPSAMKDMTMNDMTMKEKGVPLRSTAEMKGYSVMWNKAARTITLTYLGKPGMMGDGPDMKDNAMGMKDDPTDMQDMSDMQDTKAMTDDMQDMAGMQDTKAMPDDMQDMRDMEAMPDMTGMPDGGMQPKDPAMMPKMPVIVLTIGSAKAMVGGNEVTLDAAPYLGMGTAMTMVSQTFVDMYLTPMM